MKFRIARLACAGAVEDEDAEEREEELPGRGPQSWGQLQRFSYWLSHVPLPQAAQTFPLTVSTHETAPLSRTTSVLLNMDVRPGQQGWPPASIHPSGQQSSAEEDE